MPGGRNVVAGATDHRWWWWAGRADDVDAEGVYEHGECATRDEVIARILPHLDDGEAFIVVEAQFDQESDRGGDEVSPFKAERNQEFLQKFQGKAVSAQPADAKPKVIGRTELTPNRCDKEA